MRERSSIVLRWSAQPDLRVRLMTGCRAFLLMCVLTVLVPTFATRGESSVDLGEAFNESLACYSNVMRWFPPVRFQPSDLALDNISLHSESSIMDIPLKQPRGSMQVLQHKGKDLDTSLRIIELLQTGKIGAVTVSSFDLSLAQALSLGSLSSEDISACDRGRIMGALGQCTKCEIREWNNISP